MAEVGMTESRKFAVDVSHKLRAIGCSSVSWEQSGGEYIWKVSYSKGRAVITYFENQDSWNVFFPDNFSKTATAYFNQKNLNQGLKSLLEI